MNLLPGTICAEFDDNVTRSSWSIITRITRLRLSQAVASIDVLEFDISINSCCLGQE